MIIEMIRKNKMWSLIIFLGIAFFVWLLLGIAPVAIFFSMGIVFFIEAGRDFSRREEINVTPHEAKEKYIPEYLAKMGMRGKPTYLHEHVMKLNNEHHWRCLVEMEDSLSQDPYAVMDVSAKDGNITNVVEQDHTYIKVEEHERPKTEDREVERKIKEKVEREEKVG